MSRHVNRPAMRRLGKPLVPRGGARDYMLVARGRTRDGAQRMTVHALDCAVAANAATHSGYERMGRAQVGALARSTDPAYALKRCGRCAPDLPAAWLS